MIEKKTILHDNITPGINHQKNKNQEINLVNNIATGLNINYSVLQANKPKNISNSSNRNINYIKEQINIDNNDLKNHKMYQNINASPTPQINSILNPHLKDNGKIKNLNFKIIKKKLNILLNTKIIII